MRDDRDDGASQAQPRGPGESAETPAQEPSAGAGDAGETSAAATPGVKRGSRRGGSGRARTASPAPHDGTLEEPTAAGAGAARDAQETSAAPAPPARSRRRRKKTASGAAAESAAETPAERAAEPSAEHAPEATAAAADEGSSAAAGRRRRQKTARAAGEAATPAVVRVGESDSSPIEDGAAVSRRRRGSRGGRRSRARKARLAAAEQEALDRAAGEVAPDHGALFPEDELTEGAPPPLSEETGAAGAPVRAAEAAASGADTGGETAGAAAGGDEAKTAAKTSRRRGRRGGRKAAAAGEVAAAEAGAPPQAGAARTALPAEPAAAEAPAHAAEKPPAAAAGVPEPPAAAKPQRERPARRERGRPKAIVRENAAKAATPPSGRAVAGVEGPEPVAHKVILVNDQRNEVRVALVEDGRLAEMYFERPGKPSYLGDIYRARVENVVPGMDAAFIDFGLEKNGFLYVDEVETEDGRRRGRRITDVLRPGQEITVQVMKDPMGSKGARLTTHLSLAGRYLVYVPGGSGVGVSRRLGQSERERLREVAKQLKPRNAGLIVRTYARGKGLEDLRRDLQYLSRLWSRLKRKAATVKAPGLVYSEVDIALEVARDTFNETCERMLVDDEKRFKAIRAYLEKTAPELAARVELHTGAEPLFEAYGVEEQIARALERRVPLPSGGNLVIDHTEALTVIDVNSGRFTSGRSLEDTILRTNMEAAREVVRQLRLRDIGGIIVIDFIDMAHARNREAVLAKLEAELETDRTKTYVVELSPLGLVEMTRQNTTDGARGILTRTCQVCMGKGRVVSEETVALAVERRVRALARRSGAKAVLVEVNRGVAERLEANGRLKLLERETKRRVFLESSSTAPVDSIRIVAEGSVAHVQGLRVPVSEGQEVELELEFALTYSPRDAVGYIEGYMVIVEGGRPFLGERRRVRITSTSRTGATAVPVSTGEQVRRPPR